MVSVLLASTLKKSGAAYRACEEATAATSAENSEVFPLGSVAVALMIVPAEAGNGKSTLNRTFPLASVVTVVVPIKVWPWPKPEGRRADWRRTGAYSSYRRAVERAGDADIAG